jgi:hypothetical protein
MSADNWTICPKCKFNDIDALTKKQREVTASYGVIPADEYRDAVKGLREWPKLDATMREDYEQGIDNDGEYSCSYRASCQKCGFSFSFNTKIEPETVFKQGV